MVGMLDVDIQIEACGVCGSDVHTINGGYPVVTGFGSPQLMGGYRWMGSAEIPSLCWTR